MKLLEVEKEKTEKKLHEAHVSTPQLQGENKFIDRYRGKVDHPNLFVDDLTQ